MPDLTNAVPLLSEETVSLPTVAPDDLMDYVTPPAKKIIVVNVQYCEAKMGSPTPYDLPLFKK